MTETIYFDTCALNRLNDTSSQPRVIDEAEAVIRILDLVATQKLRWVASTILEFEINRNKDLIRRLNTSELLKDAAETVRPTPQTMVVAANLTQSGLARMDALHLSMAQHAKADWLITTDDRFLKAGNRQRQGQLPGLVNPVEWLQRRHLWLLQRP